MLCTNSWNKYFYHRLKLQCEQFRVRWHNCSSLHCRHCWEPLNIRSGPRVSLVSQYISLLVTVQSDSRQKVNARHWLPSFMYGNFSTLTVTDQYWWTSILAVGMLRMQNRAEKLAYFPMPDTTRITARISSKIEFLFRFCCTQTWLSSAIEKLIATHFNIGFSDNIIWLHLFCCCRELRTVTLLHTGLWWYRRRHGSQASAWSRSLATAWYLEVAHLPGKRNTAADATSRHPSQSEYAELTALTLCFGMDFVECQ